MRILLDTNIIIPLEDSSKILDVNFATLVRLSNENNHQLIAHPSSVEDISERVTLLSFKVDVDRCRISI